MSGGGPTGGVFDEDDDIETVDVEHDARPGRLDVAAATERVLKPIQQFVRGWMLTDRTEQRARELGLRSGEQLWVVGRAGVLGDGDADVATAGLGFHGPAHVREAWDTLPPGLTPRAVAAAYAELCCEWGVDALTPFDPAKLARIDVLGRRVADAAPPTLGAVFAGWRAVPQPSDVRARVALTLHVLREMRGGAHLIAIQACGLTPVEAILASPAAPPRSGPAWAEKMGFPGPFPPAAWFAEARADAERLTSMLMGRYLSVLDERELAEFAELVETTRNAIDM